MGNLLYRLLILLNDQDYDSVDYHIAMRMLQHYHELSDMTISEVAAMCNVAKSTISKVIRKLGYEDYADFRSAAPFQENKYGFDLNYNMNIAQFIEDKGISAYAEIIQRDISCTLQCLEEKSVNRLAEALVTYPKVVAMGLMFSETAALDLQEKLAYNGKFVVTSMSDLKQERLLEQIDEETLLIIYSNSGNYLKGKQLSEFHEPKDFSKVKGKLALITSNPEMENYPGVDICLCFGHSTNVQTHANIYPFVNDIIVQAYRRLSR